MGLIVPQTIKVRTNGMTCKHYREKGYEFKKCGDFIEVDVLDLPKGSHEMVKIICDVCGNTAEICYKYFIESRKKGVLISCGSNSCKSKRYEDTCIKKYDVRNVAQSKEIQDKMEATNLERYGCKNAMQNKKIQNKTRETCKKKYGVDNPSKAQEVKDKKRKTCQLHYGCDCSLQDKGVREKIEQTNLEKYGAKNPFESKEIKEKIKQTNSEKYGVEHVMQNEKIKNKVFDSFQFNGTGPSSRAQRYICHLLNGILNKHMCGSLVDIYMEKENIVIEHDGSGHFLRDKINGNALPTKESLLYEKRREDKVISNGYKMIRFIATKDKIPSDEVILNLVNKIKNLNFKIVRIDFEEGLIEKDYNQKMTYNFGKLKKVTKEDLEPFEKQEEDTSKISKN